MFCLVPVLLFGRNRDFSLATTSRPVLGSTHFSIQLVPKVLPSKGAGVKQEQREAGRSPHSNVEVCVELNIHDPLYVLIFWHFGTGTTLPSLFSSAFKWKIHLPIFTTSICCQPWSCFTSVYVNPLQCD